MSFKENLNASRPSEHPTQGGKYPNALLFKIKIRTRLDLLSIPQSGGKTVKTFRWDHRLQIQNLFMTFKRVPLLW